MRAKIRAGVTYANVASTLALLFAASGGAYAASKYLITSASQISPQALSQISGLQGSGNPGHVLHHGGTETGVWGFAAYKPGLVREPLTFSIPLPAPIVDDNVRVIAPGQEGKESAEECPGTDQSPQAKPGFLCLYSEKLEVNFVGDDEPHVQGIVLAFFLPSESTSLFGANDEGTWAITAN